MHGNGRMKGPESALTRTTHLLVSCLCLFWCLTGMVVAAPVPEEARALLRDLDSTRTRHKISAVALAVVNVRSPGGAFNFTTGLGTLSHNSPEPVDGDTVFRLGSVTKGFTALTALRLHQQELLSLDAPLSHYLDADLWHNPWQDVAPVTLAQLLEHTAGFTDLSQAEWDSAVHLPLAQALDRFAPEHRVRWQSGDWYSYTNLGAGLVGRAMEKASGRPFEDLVQSELLEPLGMRASGFDAGRVRVTGYDRDGTTVIPYWHTVYRPFAGLNASASDMARYVRLHLDRGRVGERVLFDHREIERVERPTTSSAARAGLDFGYGLGNYTGLRAGVLFHGHGGDADGYLSRFAYSLELGRGYFLAVNAFNGPALAAMRAAVERFLVADFKAADAPAPLALTPDTHAWVEGEYSLATRRFGWSPDRVETRRIRLSNGLLQYQSGKGWVDLQGVAAGPEHILLRHSAHNRATAIVFRTPDGSVRLVDDDLNLQRRELD